MREKEVEKKSDRYKPNRYFFFSLSFPLSFFLSSSTSQEGIPRDQFVPSLVNSLKECQALILEE